MKIFLFAVGFILTLVCILGYFFLFGAIRNKAEIEVFTIPLKTGETDIINNLYEQKFIRNPWAFNLLLSIKGKHDKIEPGGYNVAKNMNAFQIADKLTANPDMKWVVVPEGYRKEQIGELLEKTFNWNEGELDKWNTVYTRMKIDYIEGVYFPDTYLIPVKEDGLAIAQRMASHFEEKFAPLSGEYARQNILWTTGLKIASIIQRETADKNDMPIIAGVVWNRLNKGMKLEMDAMIQYAKGKTGDNWWGPVSAEDVRTVESPYNSYKNKGLPPYPICNPGLDAISAVINPAETDCLYYLHDKDKIIHCSETYQEHLQNIEKYLN